MISLKEFVELGGPAGEFSPGEHPAPDADRPGEERLPGGRHRPVPADQRVREGVVDEAFGVGESPEPGVAPASRAFSCSFMHGL